MKCKKIVAMCMTVLKLCRRLCGEYCDPVPGTGLSE